MERKLKKGGKVWVRDPQLAWVPGVVLGRDRDGEEGHIVVQIGRELKRSRSAETRVVDARTDCEVRRSKSAKVYSRIEDLTSIDTLHEPGLLEALEERYKQDQIYTFTGKILLAINPFKELKGVYGSDVTRMYIEAGAGEEMPAHAYAVASRAYKDVMERGGLNQTVLVSGESGAGKTETTKIIMRSITEMSQWRSGESAEDGSEGTCIADRVLESNPVLETFGNACTIRNDNSSRFGKLIEMKFDRDSGKIAGAHITTYLLEKARLTHQFANERNFHVFYEMMAAGTPEQLERWRFGPSLEWFDYIAQKENLEREDMSDASHFAATNEAMRALGIREEEIDQVFDIVAGVLHLGNLEFEALGGDAACRIKYDDKSMISCAACCELLQVDADTLERALCKRIIRVHGTSGRPRDPRNPYANRADEAFEKTMTAAEAVQARDALAMTIYERLFGWLVWRLNSCIQEQRVDDSHAHGRRRGRRPGKEDDKETVEIDERVFYTEYTIGLLDVFGFEVFERNGFEQLCINYCNERLQQLFNDFVFRKDQFEYDEEGIDWEFIKFPDNQACLDMIEAKPIGLLALIDESCMYPGGNDRTMCNKMYDHLAPNYKRFLPPSREERAAHCFTIRHFAGDVTYSSEGFFKKNKNELRQEAVDLVSASGNDIVRILLPDEAKDAAGGADIASYFDSKLGSKFHGSEESAASPDSAANSTPRSFGVVDKRVPQALQQKTVGSHFKAQLKVAMDNIRASNPHYVRCLKPNDENVPGHLDRCRLVDQLRYSGVLQIIQVVRAGYPYRFTFAEFLERYAILGKRGVPYKARRLAEKASLETQARNCVKIANQAQLVHGEEYQAGKTKIFLRQITFTILEVMKEERLYHLASVLQRAAMRFLRVIRQRRAKGLGGMPKTANKSSKRTKRAPKAAKAAKAEPKEASKKAPAAEEETGKAAAAAAAVPPAGKLRRSASSSSTSSKKSATKKKKKAAPAEEDEEDEEDEKEEAVLPRARRASLASKKVAQPPKPPADEAAATPAKKKKKEKEKSPPSSKRSGRGASKPAASSEEEDEEEEEEVRPSRSREPKRAPRAAASSDEESEEDQESADEDARPSRSRKLERPAKKAAPRQPPSESEEEEEEEEEEEVVERPATRGRSMSKKSSSSSSKKAANGRSAKESDHDDDGNGGEEQEEEERSPKKKSKKEKKEKKEKKSKKSKKSKKEKSSREASDDGAGASGTSDASEGVDDAEEGAGRGATANGTKRSTAAAAEKGKRAAKR